MIHKTPQDNSSLSRFSTDITALARKADIDPVIGRNDEIRRVIQILLRRSKSNPILIGEPGVGKTAIVYGLAKAIIDNDVPESLRGMRVLSIDFAGIVAGAKFKGEFEERLKSIIHEAIESGDILFIDEIHMIVSKSHDGSMDAANMLKQSLARGEVKCIGATTFREYRENIEVDQALTRRFQYVSVREPNRHGTIAILRGLREKYEAHHGVTIQDNAIVEAVKLSELYIRDRFQPDKAIDLMDEAATLIRMICDSKPEDIQGIEDRVLSMQIERKSLLRDQEGNEGIIAELDERIKHENAELESKMWVWREKQTQWRELQRLKLELESAKDGAIQAKKIGNLELASELLYDMIPKLTAQLREKDPGSHNHGIVTKETIATVVSKMIGVPLTRLLAEEKDVLNNLENHLSRSVIGQTHAISVIANAIRSSKAGLKDHNRPIGSFLFLGSTGVGKTELAKAITNTLFVEHDAMTVLDMSEYMEQHSVARIIGSPPGYIGHEKGGVLTEKIRRRPYQLVLFDEIEKANSEVLNILLQILDEGRITDSSGRVVNFANTIIIMTSNVGSEYFSDVFDYDTEMQVIGAAKAAFRPEFLNRIDSIIVFHNLNRIHINKICILQIQHLIDRVYDNRAIKLVIKDRVYQYIADKVVSMEWGARELKRVITMHIGYPLSSFIIDNDIVGNDTIVIDIKDNKLTFAVQKIALIPDSNRANKKQPKKRKVKTSDPNNERQ